MEIHTAMKRPCMIFLLFVLIGEYCYAQPVSTPTLPKGLRFANSADYASVHPITKGKIKPQIKADFDGNGLNDVAALVVSDENGGWGLYVFLQTSSGSWRSIILAEVDKRPNDSVSRYGLLPVKPGIYRTYCYHQPESCGRDQPKEIVVKFPAFESVELESHSGIYYWDEASQTFKGAPTSD